MGSTRTQAGKSWGMSLNRLRSIRLAAGRSPGLHITARALTALIGGYAATAASAALAARLLPVARVEATAWAMNLSFLVYGVIVLWVFADTRLKVVLLGVWGTAAIAGGAMLALGPRP